MLFASHWRFHRFGNIESPNVNVAVTFVYDVVVAVVFLAVLQRLRSRFSCRVGDRLAVFRPREVADCGFAWGRLLTLAAVRIDQEYLVLVFNAVAEKRQPLAVR